ncbi:glycosyltransferase family 1 protein [bacterium]|nr:glycosyltransferase family 1 protein [bacterium]
MEKVLVIIPNNNKGRYIAKGYSDAFRAMSYFVIEKKIYNLNVDEIKNINPNIVFIFWSDMDRNADIVSFLNECELKSTIYINLAESLCDIPHEVKDADNVLLFSSDNKKKKFRVLPAVMPESYKRKFNGYKHTITFCGNPSYTEREKLLSKIIYNFGIINVFCRSYDFYKSVDDIYKNKFLSDKYIDLYRESYRGYIENQKELSYIYSHSKINIDLPSKSEKSINYRCLEILASGGFLLAPHNKTLVKYLDDGQEIETFKSSDDLIDKIRFYIKNTNLALLITAKGKRNIVSNHSFHDRLKIILKVLNDKNISNR